MVIGGKEFLTKGKTYCMGILNVTPDSFSDGGKFDQKYQALKHVEQMLSEGMDILDIGGESTRPGHQQISIEEEIQRIAPIIETVKKEFDVPISLDTYKPQVAKAGIEAGVDLINDIWGLKYDSEMAKLISENQLPCCLMHNRENSNYQNFLEDVIEDLRETLSIAVKFGIQKENIILDPGVGFGKTYEQNLRIIHHLEELNVLGYPLLLGTSRKSVIGLTLDLPTDQRVEGTIVTTVLGLLSGCMFVRVHDVKENVRAIKMAETILRENK